MQIINPKIFRITVILIWVVLFGALLNRDYFVRTLEIGEQEALERGRQESFLAIYFKDERIGYVKHRLVPGAPGQVELRQEAFMVLNILDDSYPVDLRVRARLTDRFLLQDFNFHFTSPFYRMSAQGEVRGREVRLALTTGKETIDEVIRLDQPPYLATNQRAFLLRHDLKEGDKIRVPYFDPLSLSGKDTVVEYRGLDKILIQGRVRTLHRFEENYSGIRINSWLDDSGRVVKEESPAGFVFIAEPEFKATDITVKGREILSSVSVRAEGAMPEDPERLSAMRYRLALPEGVVFELDQDRQSLTNDILTVSRETLPANDGTACTGPEEELASTPYIQASNQMIRDRAAAIAGDTDRPMEMVRRLTGWVYDNLEKRPVLGIPDARTTLETRIGDCNEHAALFAALARSLGIPTRLAAGVTFHEGAFYYHAWNEVCIDDQWLSLDTTKNQLPADLTHLKFATGEIRELVKIGALIGKLGIEILP